MPENCVSVARPGIFGNPFTLQMGSREWALREFSVWLNGDTVNRWPELIERREKLLARLPELKGKDVACFCAEGQPCHGDYLIELANREPGAPTLPEEITIKNNGQTAVVKTDQYIIVKTRHLRQFGYSTLTKEDVAVQLGIVLSGKGELSIIGHFIKDDIVVEPLSAMNCAAN